MSQLEIEAVIAAVIVHEGALKRVPKPLELPGLTYYSKHDIWLFQARADGKVCDLCLRHQEHGEYHGNHVRWVFPYHKILDINTIGGMEPDGDGLVHPNCRCQLVRLLEET